jgi:hypothetical protein
MAMAARTRSATPPIATIVVRFDDEPESLGGGSGWTMGAAPARVEGVVAIGFVVVEVVVELGGVVVTGVVVVVVVVVVVLAVVGVVVCAAGRHGTMFPARSKQIGTPNAGGIARGAASNNTVATRKITTGRPVATVANGERRRPEPAMQTPLRASADAQASAGRAFQFAARRAGKPAW